MSKDKEPEKKNPLLAFVGNPEKPMTTAETKQAFAPENEQQAEPIALQVPDTTPITPALPQALPGMEERKQDDDLRPPTPNPRFPNGPAVMRRRHDPKAKYRERYTPRTWQIDNRILRIVDDLVERSGYNDTVGINRIMLFVLLECGYLVDENILSDPVFKVEEDAQRD